MKSQLFRRLMVGLSVGYLVFFARSYNTFTGYASESPIQYQRYGEEFATDTAMSNAIWSLLFVLLAFGLGFALRIKFLARSWNRAGAWVIVPSLIGATVIIFSEQLGLTNICWDRWGLDLRLREMNPALWSLLYFLTIFPIVNWPRKAADQ